MKKNCIIYIDTSVLFRHVNGGILNIHFISFIESICEMTKSKIVLLGSQLFKKFFKEDILYKNDVELDTLLVQFDILAKNRGWIADQHVTKKKITKNNCLYICIDDGCEYITSIADNKIFDKYSDILHFFNIHSFDFRENIELNKLTEKLEKFYE